MCASTPTYDLLLREKEEADALCADPDGSARLLPRFVLTGSAGVAAYAVVQASLLHMLGDRALPEVAGHLPVPLTAAMLFVAFEAGFLGSHVAGLPSYYFYALLAGIRTHSWRLVAESMRARATASVVLLGLLPVYLAGGLGLCLLTDGTYHDLTRVVVLLVGYALPFVAGLAAPATLLRSVLRLAKEQPGSRRATPILLTLAWTALFTAMAPLGVFRTLAWLASLVA